MTASSPQPYPADVQPSYQPAPAPRASKKGRNIAIGCAGVVVLLLLCGALAAVALALGGKKAMPTAQDANAAAATTVPKGAQTYGVNQPVSVKNWDVTVAEVERPGTTLTWTSYGNTTPAAGTWLVVAVTLTNTGKTNFGVNYSDFELHAADGVTYKPSVDFGSISYATYKGGQPIANPVPPGVSVRIYLVFDVNPTATDLRLVFKQDKRPVFTLGNAQP